MKSLLVLLTVLSTTIAMADIPRPTPVKPAKPASTLSVIKNAKYEVKVVQPKCGPQAKCMGGLPSTVVTLSLPLKGCVDSSFVTYSIDENSANSDVKVTVSAINVANPASKTTRCVAAPMDTKYIVLGGTGMASKNVTVEFLKTAAE